MGGECNSTLKLKAQQESFTRSGNLLCLVEQIVINVNTNTHFLTFSVSFLVLQSSYVQGTCRLAFMIVHGLLVKYILMISPFTPFENLTDYTPTCDGHNYQLISR